MGTVSELAATYLAQAFSNKAPQNSLRSFECKQTSCPFFVGSRSSTITSNHSPYCQNWPQREEKDPYSEKTKRKYFKKSSFDKTTGINEPSFYRTLSFCANTCQICNVKSLKELQYMTDRKEKETVIPISPPFYQILIIFFFPIFFGPF